MHGETKIKNEYNWKAPHYRSAANRGTTACRKYAPAGNLTVPRSSGPQDCHYRLSYPVPKTEMARGIERRNYIIGLLAIEYATEIRYRAVANFFFFFLQPRVDIGSWIHPPSRSVATLPRVIGRKTKLTSDHHVFALVKDVWDFYVFVRRVPLLLLTRHRLVLPLHLPCTLLWVCKYRAYTKQWCGIKRFKVWNRTILLCMPCTYGDYRIGLCSVRCYL
jgi:hypothetical protein